MVTNSFCSLFLLSHFFSVDKSNLYLASWKPTVFCRRTWSSFLRIANKKPIQLYLKLVTILSFDRYNLFSSRDQFQIWNAADWLKTFLLPVQLVFHGTIGKTHTIHFKWGGHITFCREVFEWRKWLMSTDVLSCTKRRLRHSIKPNTLGLNLGDSYG